MDFAPGQRVEADITGTLPNLAAGVVTQATVIGPGEVPGTFIVQTDAPFDGNNMFQLAADRLALLPK